MKNSLQNKEYFISEFIKYNKRYSSFDMVENTELLCNTSVSNCGKINYARFSHTKYLSLQFYAENGGYKITYGEDETYFVPIEHMLYLIKNPNDFQYQVLYTQTIHNSIAIFKFLMEFLSVPENNIINIFNTTEDGNFSIFGYTRYHS